MDTNPVWNIWSDVKTRVGTLHKILRCLRSTFNSWVSGGVGTPHGKKGTLEGGDTAHTFLIRGTIGLGTTHNIVRKSLGEAS